MKIQTTHPNVDPLHHQLQLIAKEVGVEAEVIDAQVQPALAGKLALQVAAGVV